MKHFLFLLSISTLFVLACAPESEPRISLGHEWNTANKVVADTTSVFKARDVIVVQYDNGKPFPTDKVELRVYQDNSDRLLFKREIAVKSNDSKATLKGPDRKPLLVEELLRTSTPGAYRIAFALGDSIVLQKKLELVK